MSDAPQGEGWWQASDLRWYPPNDAATAQRRTSRWALPVALLVVVAVIAGGITFLIIGPDDTVEATVALEASDELGPDPFTDSVTITEVSEFPDAVHAVVRATTDELSTDDATGTLVATGDTPGLYGGTGEDACDVASLNRYLTDDANSERSAAWASASGISTDAITSRLGSLTSAVLTIDTLVTNNGFSAGVASPRQSVLQAGTAVLVDDLGVPRVRCSCGNPLSEPVGVDLTTASTTGAVWAGYEPAVVTSPAPAPEVIEAFTVLDVENGDTFQQPTGSNIGATWVAVGNDPRGGVSEDELGTISLSGDGVDWQVTHQVEGRLSAVAKGDGGYVAVGSREGDVSAPGITMTSQDGSSWSEAAEIEGAPFHDVAYGDGTFVAVSGTRAYTSSDGASWTEHVADPDADATNLSLGSIAFGDGQFLLTTTTCGASRCSSLDVLSSRDGETWTPAGIDPPDPATNAESNGESMAYNNGFGAVGLAWDELPDGQPTSSQTTSPFAAVLDGESWTPLTPTPADLRLASLSAAGGTWYAVGHQGAPDANADTIYSSTDLTTWAPIGTPGTTLTDVIVAPGITAPEPAPTTTTTTSTTTTAPPSSPTWDEIKDADIPEMCGHPPTTLVDGKDVTIGPNDGFFELMPTLSNGTPGLVQNVPSNDAGPLTAVAVSCNAGGVGFPNSVMFFSAGGQFYGLHDPFEEGVDWESAGMYGPARDGLITLTLEGDQVQVYTAAEAPGDAACCPTTSAVLLLRAGDGAITVTSVVEDLGD